MCFDTFNREIVGFGLTDRRGGARPYFDGLAQVIDAVKRKEQSDPTILHTDQGSVYSSRAFNELLSNHTIVHSMSRAGTPTDNPIDESLNGWIKDELFIDFNLRKCDDVLSLIKAYVRLIQQRAPHVLPGIQNPTSVQDRHGVLRPFYGLSTFR